MKAQERKENTEACLQSLNIPFNPGLPPVEEENDVVIRPPSDIAKRILILAYLAVYSAGGDKNEIIPFLKSEGLWASVSENEKKLLSKKKLTAQDKIDISWRSEGNYLMLWAINKIDTIGLPTDQCDIGAMADLLPCAFDSTRDFIQHATRRTTEEILDKSDLIYRLHWATREAESNDQEIPGNLDTGIVEEWHYAINWITYYDENWDGITTDT